MSVGAVVVGLYPTNTAGECAYVLGHSEAVLAFAEDDAQREKLGSVRVELPALREIVGFDELPAFEAQGRSYAELEPDKVREDDLATLIYTSGTTGPPKGCMLTHKNLMTAALRVKTHIEGQTDTVLLFLPLAHSFGRIVHHSAASRGAALALVADATRVPEAIDRVRPTILPAVPRVYEKIHANVLGEIERSSGAKRAIGRWALGVGARASRLRRAGHPVPRALRLQEKLADRLVFAKVRGRLGGRLRLGVSGAAPLGIDVLEFFHSLGMLVIEGYGLTETSSSLSVNDPDDYRFGTVGRAVDGCDIRLDADGEILVRSETIFTGYYKDPDATAAAFTDDGWFRTGDVGELDEDGYLKIVDRKKELIISAAGKNMSPANIEAAIKTASPLIGQACCIGDRRPYNSALIVLDADFAPLWAAQQGIEDTSLGSLARDERARAAVQEGVDAGNAKLARVEQIKRFHIVEGDWLPGSDELTPTMKLKRKPIAEKYAAAIEQMYAAQA